MAAIITTPADFAGVAGQVPTSVAIALIDGEPFGTTVGSLAVISSSSPPIGLFARTRSPLERAITDAGRFTVSVLAEDQSVLAERLARSDRPIGWGSFGGYELIRRDSSPPVVAGSVAWVDCLLEAQNVIGDHTMLIGRAIESARNPTKRPLTYYRGRWQRLAAQDAPNAFPIRSGDQTYVW